MRRKPMIPILLSPLLLSSLVFSLNKGGLKGKVLDDQNNPIAEASVTIISVDYPSVQYKLTTNKKGEYIQIGLESGYYRVRCEKEVYQSKEEQVKVPMSEIVEMDFTLKPAAQALDVQEVAGKKELREANAFFQQDKYEEALAAYREAAEHSPDDANIQYNIGVTFMAMGRVEEAIVAFKRTLEIQPESGLAMKNLGQLYGELKNYEEAVKYYSKAARLNPGDAEMLFNLGVGQLNLGNLEAALSAFKESIMADEGYADSHYQLGLIYLNQNKLDEARTALEEFLRLAPQDSRAESVEEMIRVIKKSGSSSPAI